MESSQYFWLRSTGFPIHHLTALGELSALPGCAAFERTYRALENMRVTLLAHANAHPMPQACRKLIRKLNERTALQPADLPEDLRLPLAQALAERNRLLTELQVREEADAQYAAYLERARQGLIDVLDDDAIAEALFISNPAARARIDELIRDRHSSNDSRKKQKLRLGWAYLQRFCAKNDTASFFGPLAWGQFDQQLEANVHCRRSEGPWLRQRHTFFENWVVQRLVAQLNQHCPNTDVLPLRLNDGCYLDGHTLHLPIGKRRQVDAQTTRILQHIASQQQALATLCQLLQASPAQMHGSIRALVEHLVRQRVVRRGWRVSPRERDPMAQLQAWVNSPGIDETFSQAWHARLDALQAARAQYADGNLQQREQALLLMNTLLADAGVDLSRETGAMYVGRYPVYEDCSRNLEISFGRHLFTEMKAQLTPLLNIHRWMTKAIGYRLHEAYLQVWEQCAQVASEGVPFLALLDKLAPLLPTIEADIANDLEQRLGAAWDNVLQGFVGQHEVHLGNKQVEALLDALDSDLRVNDFQVFGSDFHSPDFMLSSASIEALNQGDYRIVVGEVHPAVHTLSQPVAAPFSPFNTQINEQVAQLFERPRLILADSPDSYQRSHIDWPLQSRYLQLVLPSGGGCVPPQQQFAAGRAQVRLVNGRLHVVDVFGQFEEDFLCVFSTPMHRLGFALAGAAIAKHDNRRVWLGRTLYKRASWLFTVDELPQPKGSIDALDYPIAWRAWASQQGLPRYVFVKIDTEPKPQFIDFENPLSLDGIINALKDARQVKFSEMRPDPEQLWLEEARGRFCCEIRTTFSCNEDATQ